MIDHDLDMSIVEQVRAINRQTGTFISGILYNTVTEQEQISYASQLVDLAITIKTRAERDARVIEGETDNDSTTSHRGDSRPDGE